MLVNPDTADEPLSKSVLNHERVLYAPYALGDFRRTHRLLRNRMTDLQTNRFGHAPRTDLGLSAG